jgi:hypothetical protein
MGGWTVLVEETYSLSASLKFSESGVRICSTYLSKFIVFEHSCPTDGSLYPYLCPVIATHVLFVDYPPIRTIILSMYVVN